MSIIYEDTRQQAGKHEAKHEWWAAHGVTLERRRLDTGDYMRDGSNVTVDTKKGLEEIAQNIGGRSHRRFSEECKRAQRDGLRLVVLVENVGGFSSLRDVPRWTNTHCVKCSVRKAANCNPRDLKGKCAKHGTKKPIQGEQLCRAMATMTKRYGVVFDFCTPQDAARRVCEYLGVQYD